MGLIVRAILIGLLAVPLSGEWEAHAQDGNSASNSMEVLIGVINMEAVVRDAQARKDIDSQVAEHAKRIQTDIRTVEKTLRESEAELGRQRSVVSAEVFEAKKKEFLESMSKAQRHMQANRAAVSAAKGVAMKTFENAMREAIIEVASEKGISLLFRRREVVIAPKALELDREVLALLNKKLPAVTVDVQWPVEP
ncbi:OmpH family outer membrane protein [Magnetospira sp. QH-2]|uniref:OmpH family outer membrane protein n=1 Tax=Magnetospira sp. (strain QH-2) TaxID=1288970 RepID=UPI0003E80F3E|nr:OmpH family outer membrane protein [Magnetospira sp. QH-2]CCQ73979.1 Putative OmpH, Outer membrane chaperone Skp [Magnetospira sp. QH-2]